MWSGPAIFSFSRLTRAGRFVLILYDLVERVPEVCDGFVFRRHRKDLLDLAIENVCQGEEFFETLVFSEWQQNELADATNPRTRRKTIFVIGPTEDISDTRRSRSWAKNESSSLVRDMEDGRDRIRLGIGLGRLAKWRFFYRSITLVLRGPDPGSSRPSEITPVPRFGLAARLAIVRLCQRFPTSDYNKSEDRQLIDIIKPRPLPRNWSTTLMPPRDPDEEFEFLVNLLASDGVEPDPSPAADATGLQEDKNVDDGLRIQRGSDGRLDLGQVRAFYEKKHTGKERRKGVGRVGLTNNPPGTTDRSRNCSGVCLFRA